MHLDLCHFFGLLHWICCIQITETGNDFLSDKTLRLYFVGSHTVSSKTYTGMLEVIHGKADSIHQGNNERTSLNERHITTLLGPKTLLRRKRAEQPKPPNSTERPNPRNSNNTNGAKAYAFGNPSLPKKSKKRKPPRPGPLG